jgi:hypothetical protein
VSTDRPWPLPPPPVKLQCFFCPGETYSPDGICGQCKQEGKSYPSVTVDGVPVEGKWEIGKLPDGAGEVLHSILGGSEPEPGPPWTHTIVPPEPVTLTSSDPEPPPGTVVRDDCGVTWERYGEDEGNYWLRVDGDGDSDPESWTKIAGNYGPVTVIEEPGPAFTLTERIEITAEFCQCRACRAERCEP